MINLHLREDPSHKFLVYRSGSFHAVKAFWSKDKAREWVKRQSRATGLSFEVRTL